MLGHWSSVTPDAVTAMRNAIVKSKDLARAAIPGFEHASSRTSLAWTSLKYVALIEQHYGAAAVGMHMSSYDLVVHLLAAMGFNEGPLTIRYEPSATQQMQLQAQVPAMPTAFSCLRCPGVRARSFPAARPRTATPTGGSCSSKRPCRLGLVSSPSTP